MVSLRDSSRRMTGLPTVDWPKYGHGLDGGHYSPLAQIHRGNVGALAPTWRFDVEASGLQTSPLVVDGVPVTYSVGGGQYVVIAASDVRDPAGPQGSAYLAFALGGGSSRKN